jgi:hypothetical protein
MARFLLHYLLPLLLPFVFYIAYVGLARRRLPRWLDETPWLILLGAGAALLAASLVTWGLLSGAPPEHTYLPPRLEDGRIVPAETVEQP